VWRLEGNRGGVEGEVIECVSDESVVWSTLVVTAGFVLFRDFHDPGLTCPGDGTSVRASTSGFPQF